jgi:hypothetical protein
MLARTRLVSNIFHNERRKTREKAENMPKRFARYVYLRIFRMFRCEERGSSEKRKVEAYRVELRKRRLHGNRRMLEEAL